MVTGRVPFDGTTPSAVMHKHLKEPLIPPDHLNKALSAGVGEIIEVMMAKSRDDRYPSMQDVINDLESVAAGEAPMQAREKYDHNLLENLTSGNTIADSATIAHDVTGVSPRIAIQWVLLLGVLLVISILCNVVLLANR
jgi:serine/threonine-protein kinase